jgi:hypothetical protein
MVFNFLTARFMREKKNWEAATSNNPALLATISEACESSSFHRVFTTLSPLVETDGSGVGTNEDVAKSATSGVRAT